MTRPALSDETLEAVLIDLMSAYSEENWAAGWMGGIEFMTWRDLKKGIADDALLRIEEVAHALGRWPIWNQPDDDVTTIPLAEFEALFADTPYAEPRA